MADTLELLPLAVNVDGHFLAPSSPSAQESPVSAHVSRLKSRGTVEESLRASALGRLLGVMGPHNLTRDDQDTIKAVVHRMVESTSHIIASEELREDMAAMEHEQRRLWRQQPRKTNSQQHSSTDIDSNYNQSINQNARPAMPMAKQT